MTTVKTFLKDVTVKPPHADYLQEGDYILYWKLSEILSLNMQMRYYLIKYAGVYIQSLNINLNIE